MGTAINFTVSISTEGAQSHGKSSHKEDFKLQKDADSNSGK